MSAAAGGRDHPYILVMTRPSYSWPVRSLTNAMRVESGRPLRVGVVPIVAGGDLRCRAAGYVHHEQDGFACRHTIRCR